MKPKVLIVDDDPLFASDLVVLLEDRYRCWSIQRPTDIEEDVRRIEPDLVLLDVMLGDDVDGFRVLERMRAAGCTAPVIMMSDRPSIPTVIEAMKRGVFSFLPKTTGLEDLRSSLQQALEERGRSPSDTSRG